MTHPGLVTAGSSNHPPPEGLQELVRARRAEGPQKEPRLGSGPRGRPLPAPPPPRPCLTQLKPHRSHENERAQAMRSTGPVPCGTERVREGWRRPGRPQGRGRQTENNPQKLLGEAADASHPMARRRHRHIVSFGSQAPEVPGAVPVALTLSLSLGRGVAWCPCPVNLPLASDHYLLPTGLLAP